MSPDQDQSDHGRDIAEIIAFPVSRPRVSLNEILVRPTAQAR